jgi:hypothetical protein
MEQHLQQARPIHTLKLLQKHRESIERLSSLLLGMA